MDLSNRVIFTSTAACLIQLCRLKWNSDHCVTCISCQKCKTDIRGCSPESRWSSCPVWPYNPLRLLALHMPKQLDCPAVQDASSPLRFTLLARYVAHTVIEG